MGNIQLEDICKGVGKIKKIKVYRDAGGIPKGDALVVFDAKLNRDVAGDAVEELDGKEIDQGGLGSYVIAVQEAVFKEPRRPVIIPQPPPMPAPAPAAPRSRGPVAAPPDCPKALLKNCFDATKLAARDTQLEDEVGYECTKHGRVIDAECLVAGGDAGSMLVSFTTVEAARRCCVATGVRHRTQLAAYGGFGYAHAANLARAPLECLGGFAYAHAANQARAPADCFRSAAPALAWAKKPKKPKVDTVTLRCTLCGTTFEVKRGEHYGKYDFVYCGRACLGAHRERTYAADAATGPTASAQGV